MADTHVPGMRFDRDLPNGERTFRERGFNFAFASRVFGGRVVIDAAWPASRKERRAYREQAC
jgi:hypothetical protein